MQWWRKQFLIGRENFLSHLINALSGTVEALMNWSGQEVGVAKTVHMGVAKKFIGVATDNSWV